MAINKKQIGAIVGAVVVVALAGGGIAIAANANSSNSADVAPTGSTEDQVAAATSFDLSSKNADDRPTIDPVADAVASLKASGFQPIEPGKLTVAQTVASGAPPLVFAASDDNTTALGSEADFAALVADGLGLDYNPVSVDWADWPLGIQSGKYDIILNNVTVTEERKELYDFASYRVDLLGFFVKSDSDITSITEAKDISGLTIIVGSGTNQEKILLAWNEELTNAGKKPAELVYYNDTAAANLAIQSGRADANFEPNASGAYAAASSGDLKGVGTVSGGWPQTADIAAATKKGNGLIDAVNIVLNAAIDGGEYQQVLDRWGLDSESIPKSEINPPGLPKTD
ncbi:amino acid ABC transporter substrate-binding protein, PAAT family [Agreia bicolorata]|uniref:Amino acid ABC transporter substrate-binding protein, PAAT family n=1 Tax=Agreia bicolorata TaxID=110935 RepID=A0A1T4WZX0_9MICO|nr:ABC transporter substrate-binding protein [Agreia bicolorata]SKA82890.1 amino acid ABC transporter substrate-binding protein, PAAT family [Agreia bicolorata]